MGMWGGRPPERGAGIGGIGAHPVPGLAASLWGIWGAASLVYLRSSARPPTPPTPISLGALGGLGKPPGSMLGGGVEYWPRQPGDGRPGEGRDGAGEW